MKKEFAQFLPLVIPSLFQMATLNPEMRIAGSTDSHNLVDLLSEVKPNTTEKKEKMNITTDETEEKDVAIQMLAVFVDELGGAYIEHVEATSKILLSMISYEANDSIRNSVASTLPGLVKCIKEAHPTDQNLIITQGRFYLEKLFEAMKTETETETLSF